jgi:uncharacterized membrane protein YuzA (DUF378 family)
MMKNLNFVASLLLIVGGLNWGLVALANTDIVAALFGAGTTLSTVVYVLVGVSAVFQLVQLAGCCCNKPSNSGSGCCR